MSDEHANGAAAAATGGQPQQQPRLAVLAQYVKDLSFENPRAPHSLRQGQPQPQILVNVDVKAQKLDDKSTFEVVLTVNARAEQGDDVGFLAELQYAGLFSLENFPNEAIEPICMVECPRILFPFARRILSDVTRDGGFPPLMLETIDFTSLYRQQKLQQAQQTGAGTPSADA
ncbi:protein-export chaperone SecB [Oceanibacterium hippocampi]|uniref:Protein-export protein SecB n=1 Tax=Oceanibacterium hippocampi TaxID=745714 RepID=A0A1Y5RP23_9PROT|nr:protein-export chaperone SecB [Oceanibacterium hippocampi]SLN20990.1 Protein-export protein SecB [Oceanibacterium hippocampi]